jgi:arylsulfatase A-like enzyme
MEGNADGSVSRSVSKAVCWASLLLVLIVSTGCVEAPRPRNAILIVLDTLRADRVSAYGHERPTTPVLDRLAEGGVLFESVVSHSSWTLPAMVGLLSGHYPTAREYDDGLRHSLVEPLREAGWKTAAFTGGAWVGEQYGLGRGFDVFEDQIAVDIRLARAPERPAGEAPLAEVSKGIEKTFAAAEQWLEANADAPFFLWLHTYEPHTPYRRQLYTAGMERGVLEPTFEVAAAAVAGAGGSGSRLGETELAFIRALYDGGVTVSDQYIGRLLDTLDRLGLDDDTLIVVTSDHGEDLGERSPPRPGNHGHALWDELLLVPLIVFDPTREYPVRRVPSQVRLIDVMPTLLDILGAPFSEPMHASSLLPLMLGEESSGRPAWSVIDPQPKSGRSQQFAIRSETHKLILTPALDENEDDSIALYDLANDPQESRNIADSAPATAQALRASLAEVRAERSLRGDPDYRSKRAIPPPVKRRLRALGYIE